MERGGESAASAAPERDIAISSVGAAAACHETPVSGLFVPHRILVSGVQVQSCAKKCGTPSRQIMVPLVLKMEEDAKPEKQNEGLAAVAKWLVGVGLHYLQDDASGSLRDSLRWADGLLACTA
ncbi:unnamed protein product [Effrenium voratum]|nr:unnamed protein product [Effrenium voratum]